MAYTDEALKAKLSTLNETQDSIVSVSQWITFHKRHADKISSYWLTRLRESPPPKRLNFIYLVNDIVQNARARKRAEFPDAFSPLMPEAVATAYRSSTPEIQGKIRRVVEVWRGRSVWEPGIQTAIEARLDDVDKTKSSSGKKTLGGSLFNNGGAGSGDGGAGGMPAELATLPPLQIATAKATLTATPALATAQSEYTKLTNPELELPSPPVHAARLSSLMKSLATAESTLNASIKARQALIADLERILSSNKSTLEQEESTLSDLTTKRTEIETKKRDVEDSIMRGLTADAGPEDYSFTDVSGLVGGGGNSNGGNKSHDRPEVEELTPEPETFIPPTPGVANETLSPQNTNSQPSQTSHPELQGLLAGFSPRSGSGSGSGVGSNANMNQPSDNRLHTEESTNVLAGRVRQASGSVEPSPPATSPTASSTVNGFGTKRRKTSHPNSIGNGIGGIGGGNMMGESEFVPDLGEMGMDINEFIGGGGVGAIGAGADSVVQDGNSGNNANDLLGTFEGDIDELIRSRGFP